MLIYVAVCLELPSPICPFLTSMLQRLVHPLALTICGLALASSLTPSAQGQGVMEVEEVIIEGSGPENSREFRPLNQEDSVLNVAAGRRLMNEANEAINLNQYTTALEKLQEARKIFNQLSNFHLQLANSFSGINNVIFEEQRIAALETGQLRDEATYRLALVHRANNEPALAVPLLLQIIRSQNPTTDLGRKSYQQLYELGFVASPFEGTTPTGTNAAPTAPVVN